MEGLLQKNGSGEALGSQMRHLQKTSFLLGKITFLKKKNSHFTSCFSIPCACYAGKSHVFFEKMIFCLHKVRKLLGKSRKQGYRSIHKWRIYMPDLIRTPVFLTFRGLEGSQSLILLGNSKKIIDPK